MANSYEIIFQYEATTALVDAYTVPALTQVVVSTVHICNFTGVAETVTVKVAKGGAADTDAHYLFADLACDANDSFAATIGITLNAGDIIRIQASANNTIAVNFFGSIIT